MNIQIEANIFKPLASIVAYPDPERQHNEALVQQRRCTTRQTHIFEPWFSKAVSMLSKCGVTCKLFVFNPIAQANNAFKRWCDMCESVRGLQDGRALPPCGHMKLLDHETN
jgi:hypothetical protein